MITKVFDLHCDTPLNIKKHKFNHIIPIRLHKAGYLGAVFAHFIYPHSRHPFDDAVKLLASTVTYLKKIETIKIIYSFKDFDKKKVNIILGVEGGHCFDKSFRQVETLYNLGLRIYTLTWNNSNRLAHSALDNDKNGLTEIGKEYLKEFSRFNIILDLSHASTKTVLDVCDQTENAVLASHSCIRGLNSFKRNISDEAIGAIVSRAGVVGINFSKGHLGDKTILEHIDYIKNKFGTRYIAIGSDFDGIRDSVIANPSAIADLQEELLNKNYKQSDIDGIFNKNFLRVLARI